MTSATATQRKEKRRSFLPSRTERPLVAALRVGDAVVVGGVKSGRLCYVGQTSFAEGEWCGVELATLEGRHDGAVDGRRYFQCEPRRGIFAPVARVKADRNACPPAEKARRVRAEGETAAGGCSGGGVKGRGRLRQRYSASRLLQRDASEASSDASSLSPRVDAHAALTLTYVIGGDDSDSDVATSGGGAAAPLVAPPSDSDAGEWDAAFCDVMTSSLVSNASSLGLLTDDQLTLAANWDMSGGEGTPPPPATRPHTLTSTPTPATRPHALTSAPTPTAWVPRDTDNETFYVLPPADRLPSSDSDSDGGGGGPLVAASITDGDVLDSSVELARKVITQYARLVDESDVDGAVQARVARRRQHCRAERQRLDQLQRSLVIADLHSSTGSINMASPTPDASTDITGDASMGSVNMAGDVSPTPDASTDITGDVSTDSVNMVGNALPTQDMSTGSVNMASDVSTDATYTIDVSLVADVSSVTDVSSITDVSFVSNVSSLTGTAMASASCVSPMSDMSSAFGASSARESDARRESVASCASVDMTLRNSSLTDDDEHTRTSTAISTAAVDIIVDDALRVSMHCQTSPVTSQSADRMMYLGGRDFSLCEAKARPLSLLSTCSVDTDVLDEASTLSERPASMLSTNIDDIDDDTVSVASIECDATQIDDGVTSVVDQEAALSSDVKGGDADTPMALDISLEEEESGGCDILNTTVVLEALYQPANEVIVEQIKILDTSFTEADAGVAGGGCDDVRATDHAGDADDDDLHPVAMETCAERRCGQDGDDTGTVSLHEDMSHMTMSSEGEGHRVDQEGEGHDQDMSDSTIKDAIPEKLAAQPKKKDVKPPAPCQLLLPPVARGGGRGRKVAAAKNEQQSLLEQKNSKNVLNRKKIDILQADEKSTRVRLQRVTCDVALRLAPQRALPVVAPLMDGGAGAGKRTPVPGKWGVAGGQQGAGGGGSGQRRKTEAKSRLGLGLGRSNPLRLHASRATPPPPGSNPAPPGAGPQPPRPPPPGVNHPPQTSDSRPAASLLKAPRRLADLQGSSGDATVATAMMPPLSSGRPRRTKGRPSSAGGSKPGGKTIPTLRRAERSPSVSSDSQLSCSSVSSYTRACSPHKVDSRRPRCTVATPGTRAATSGRQAASDLKVTPPSGINKRKSVAQAGTAKLQESNKRVGLVAPSGRAVSLPKSLPGASADLRVPQKNTRGQQQQQSEQYHKKNVCKTSTPRATGRLPAPTSRRPPPDLLPPGTRRQEELSRLQSLCEVQARELGLARHLLRQSATGFTATAVLIDYLTHRLDAFSCPRVKSTLQRTRIELDKARTHTGELMCQRDALIQEIQSINQQHDHQVELQQQQHQGALAALEERLRNESDSQLEKAATRHRLDMDSLKTSHEVTLESRRRDHEASLDAHQAAHETRVDSLRQDHGRDISGLQTEHQAHLEEFTARFEDIKCSLSDKLDQLRCECECLRGRERAHELEWQRDADARHQAALAPLRHAAADAASLRTVLDLRTADVHELRRECADLLKRLEELPLARERVLSLTQKLENMEAIVDIRTDNERQLSAKHQVLLRRYDKESKANKRLSMNNEQLAWRLSQGAETLAPGGSTSPTRSGGGGGMTRSGTYELLNGAQSGDDDASDVNDAARRQVRQSDV